MTESRRTTPEERRALLAVMARPRSIALFVLAMAVAVVFALLGQWQLSRASQNGHVVGEPVDDVRPISEVVQPEVFTPASAVGQLVSVSGSWVEGDFLVLRDRIDQGRSGYWTAGHFRTEAGDTLAVGLGWTEDRDAALAAADRWNSDAADLPTDLEGRYQTGESPEEPDPDDPLPAEMSAAAFVNQWADPGPAYPGYITLREAPSALETIDSPAPEVEVELNFLNLFYAAEWVLFSGAAIYIWYRLIRDVYEKEREEAALAAAGPDPGSDRDAEDDATGEGGSAGGAVPAGSAQRPPVD
ncbi:SURF1 family protein [Naasia sp. SYSU D00057]|uniref:SURF1 family protein n=1 Tax=Naasia sp. SYSU D00057 TaxID=2817380 RepID=UPI001B30B6AF|nr:SURF1 family cytochrome oxidase biogenesis protein [Naasia sp. SYSU D00057]